MMHRCISNTKYIQSKPITFTSLTHLHRYNFTKQSQHVNTKDNTKLNILFPIFGVTMGTLAIGAVVFNSYYKDKLTEEHNHVHTVHNWSETHNASPIHYYEPKSTKEVENIVAYCHANTISLRPMGSGISPNGIGFSDNGIIDLSQCNTILNIDVDKKQITVESGIQLSQIISAIKPYNMAIENIPSIQSQQIGGLMQVGAHGTGAHIGPCDTQIVSMTVITPQHGKIVLNSDDDNDLFNYFRVGLGTLGVVTEVTLQCVERHKLKQSLWVMDVDELIQKRNELISNYKHIRWLWIPYNEDKVIVIASNEYEADVHVDAIRTAIQSDKEDEMKCQQPLRALYEENVSILNESDLCFADLRDLLIGREDANYVLDTEWIKQINAAEMKYWCNVSDLRNDDADWSENILSFECGGQQWVYEICFECDRTDNNDIPTEIEFALEVLKRIKENNLAAPAPIEHRFTARSTSYLSPAYSENDDGLFSWFGIIFYIPTQTKQKRQWIANEFREYSRILNDIADQYGAVGHWAKVETQNLNECQRNNLHNRIRKRFGDKFDTFLRLRNKYDPKGILLNDIVSDLFDI